MVVPVAPTASLRVGAPVLLRKVWPTTSRPAHQFLLASESPVFGGGVEAHVFRHTPRVDSHRERLGEHSSSADGADAGSPLTAAAGTGWSELPLVRRFVARDQHERDNTLASTVTRSSVAVLQRQELPATSSGAASAAAPEPAAAAEASKQAGAAGADIEELLDRLSRRLWRELAIERERRGTGPWL